MEIKTAVFAGSFVSQAQFPKDHLPEIALVGRSNVGKSSLINCLANRKALAKTSSRPGKTRTLNFYKVNNKFYFVDLPGYGFARVSKQQKEKWGKMIEDYLQKRNNLVGVIMIVDIRHLPSEDDILMYEWLKYYGIKTAVVATKADKISRAKQLKNFEEIKKALGFHRDDYGAIVSSTSRQGKDELLKIIEKLLET
jgi:GTP-binding protein